MSKVNTKEAFAELVSKVEAQEGYRKPIGFGICRVDRGQINEKKILQATFPVVNWNENFGSAAIFINALQKCGENIDFSKSEQIFEISSWFIEICMRSFSPFLYDAYGDKHKNVQVIKILDSFDGVSYKCEEYKDLPVSESGDYKVVFIFEDFKPESVESVYLKLYALSLGKVPLRSINLDGAFGILPNLAWSDGQPIELDYLREYEINLKLINQYPHIDFVDKFPRFLHHIIPADNTRILDTSKVRMGAQLAAGTTVMPGASYINFNAGTLGPVMVEGRISSSAIVGANSDVGGGASILGVLSGTDGNPISIGENCLLGANSVCGIPLGDGCIIDAGIAILPGTQVVITDYDIDEILEANPGKSYEIYNELEEGVYIVKAEMLSGFNGVHFRMDSVNGTIVAFRSKKEVKLNSDLH